MAKLGFRWSGSRAHYAVLLYLPRKICPVVHMGKLRSEATVAVNGMVRFMVYTFKLPLPP